MRVTSAGWSSSGPCASELQRVATAAHLLPARVPRLHGRESPLLRRSSLAAHSSSRACTLASRSAPPPASCSHAPRARSLACRGSRAPTTVRGCTHRLLRARDLPSRTPPLKARPPPDPRRRPAHSSSPRRAEGEKQGGKAPGEGEGAGERALPVRRRQGRGSRGVEGGGEEASAPQPAGEGRRRGCGLKLWIGSETAEGTGSRSWPGGVRDLRRDGR